MPNQKNAGKRNTKGSKSNMSNVKTKKRKNENDTPKEQKKAKIFTFRAAPGYTCKNLFDAESGT
jgi:hypothetical protein